MLTPAQKEMTRKWIARLRSGKDRQTRGTLRDVHGGMCCIGVLCDMVDPDGWDKDDHHVHRGDVGMAKQEVLDTVGLNPGTGARPPIDCAQEYSMRNDRGDSFVEIADELERRLALS